MHLPIIKGSNSYKKSIVAFGGINFSRSFSEGELSECTGISHISFPSLTQRRKSETLFECSAPTALIFADKECFVTDTELYYDRKKVADLNTGKKCISFLGKKIVVFPDKLFYDTQTEETGFLQAEASSDGANAKFTTAEIIFPEIYEKEVSVVERLEFERNFSVISYMSVTSKDAKLSFSGFKLKKVSDISEGDFLGEKCEANQYRRVISVQEDSEGKNCIVETELISIENPMKNIFSQFKAGDVVEISGCTFSSANNRTAEIASVEGNKLVFSVEVFKAGEEMSSVTIKRKIPNFSCVCSYENRLWGCEGNTIYASKLGDMTNFFVYKNLSTDSYSVMSNTPGDFTACIPYGNCCLFFKEDRCYKLYGNRPSNFHLTESFGCGILQEDAGSLINVNGTVFYKGSGGVYTYYGGTPVCVSQKLDGLLMENTVSGSDGKCYYISADTKEGREEFVWDMEKNLWSKSGINDVIAYCSHKGEVYRLRPFGIEKVIDEPDGEASWSITLCPFDEGYYKTKNYSRLYINVHLYENAFIQTEVSRDEGAWESINICHADEKKHISIPCVVKSCHSIKLRFSGKGKCMLESITREFSVN